MIGQSCDDMCGFSVLIIMNTSLSLIQKNESFFLIKYHIRHFYLPILTNKFQMSFYEMIALYYEEFSGTINQLFDFSGIIEALEVLLNIHDPEEEEPATSEVVNVSQ